MILGIDEVGRGPWAGPLVVGAVVLGDAEIEGLTDSKKLSKKGREALDVLIREQAAGFGLGWVTAEEIDEIGLSASLVLATKRAVEQVKATYHEIIIDGTVNFLKETTKGKYVTTLKKADLLIPSVSAASIIAKVERDKYMEEQDALYPGYSFARHVGYGTATHIAAIEKLGITPLHRLSFAPLQKYRLAKPEQRSHLFEKGMSPSGRAKRHGRTKFPIERPLQENDGIVATPQPTEISSTTQIGNHAEDEATNYLTRNGHDILDRNWKTRWCEIDIISRKEDTIYFTEVKYRKTTQQGGGFAAITPTKLKQMKFAAKYYATVHHVANADLRLAAISVGGADFVVEDFIEIG